MESGIVFGLSAALHGAITLKNGRVEQSNFDDYEVLRMNEMPVVAFPSLYSAAWFHVGMSDPKRIRQLLSALCPFLRLIFASSFL